MEIRYARKKYMEDVVSSDMQQNPKQLWSFIKSKSQDSSGVSSLIDKDGFLHSKRPIKAEILNEKLHAAYTREDTSFYKKGDRSSVANYSPVSHQPQLSDETSGQV